MNRDDPLTAGALADALRATATDFRARGDRLKAVVRGFHGRMLEFSSKAPAIALELLADRLDPPADTSEETPR